MASSDSDDAGTEVSEYANEYQLHGVGLKPVLDDIFKEVQASIPALDFEESAETSSDEGDLTVFSRSNVPLPKTHFSQEVTSPDSGLGDTTEHTTSSSTPSDHVQVRSEEDCMSPEKTPIKAFSHQASEHSTTSSASTKGSGSHSSPVSSADQFKLNFDKLELIDFDLLLERSNEVSVSAGTPLEFDLSDLDSNAESGDRDSLLMRELESLCKKQLEVAAPAPTSEIKPGKTDQQVMATPSAVSKGVSACLDPPSTTPHVSCTESDTTSKRETVFLDLRKQNNRTTEQKRNHTLPSSIQRILGIDQDQGSCSSSDEDDDVVSWQQHRQRVKEGLQSSSRGAKLGTEQKQKQKHHRAPDQCQKTTVKNFSEVEICERNVKTIPAPSSVKTQLNSTVGPEELSKRSISVSKGTSTATLDLQVVRQDPEVGKVEKFVKDHQDSVSDKRPSNFTRDPAPHEYGTNKGTEMLAAEKTIQAPSKSGTSEREKKTEKQVSDGATQTPDVSTKKKAEKKRGGSGSVEEPKNKAEDCSAASNTKDREGSAKKREEASKALDAQEKEKRARLHKSLENLRPCLSSGGHQPAAPATPVVFDQEASYEQSVDPLPLNVPGNSCLLLCGKLASCGELTNLRGGPKGGLGPNGNHSFSSLVAWLLSLVPPSQDAAGFRDMAALCEVPFHVIGLQQKWHEGQLSLDIAIRSIHDSSFRLTHNQSTKHNAKAGHSFKQTVTKFLSTNSLQSMFDKISALTSSRSQYLCSLPKNQKNLSTLLNVNPDPDAMSRVFGIRPGFFWQTMELEDFDCGVRSISCPGPEIQNTSMVMRYEVYNLPFCSLDVMTRVWRGGLNVAGLRLVYTNVSASNRVDATPGKGSTDPMLILAIRGPNAVSVWLDVVGPQDASLARLTDPNSLRAMYSKNAKEDALFSTPRTCNKAAMELARWFGGRVPENGVINVGTPNHALPSSDKVKPGNKARYGSDNLITSPLHSSTPRPPCFLTATVRSLVFLVLSPLVPVKCLGYVMSVCYDRGFIVQGIRRTQLNSRRVAGVGLSSEQVSVFCPLNSNSGSPSSSGRSSPTPNANTRTVFSFDAKSPLHTHSNTACTVLLLSKENGFHQVLSLTEVLANDLKGFSLFHPSILSQLCFVAAPYSDVALKQLGGVLIHTPDPSIYSASLWRHSFYSNPELEQVCVLTLLRDKATAVAGAILDHLLLRKALVRVSTVKEYGSDNYYGFELLGVKLMDSLSMQQAKEFSPCEIGDLHWHGSLEALMKGPALVCALRGVNAFERLRNFIGSYADPQADRACPDVFMSSTPELAYRQLSVLFHERELFSDSANRTNMNLLPPPRRLVATSENAGRKQQGRKNPLCHEELSVMQNLLLGPRPLATVCIVKPDAVPKHTGKILRSLSQEGFSIVAAKMAFLTRQQALTTIPASVLSLMVQAVNTMEEHVKHAMSGPSLLLCLMRENAVAKLLEVLGPSDPQTARKQSQFLLRGCYGVNPVCNALYGSEKYGSAVRDVKLFFPEGLCCSATEDFMADRISCLSHDEIFNATARRSLAEVGNEMRQKAASGSGAELPSSLLEVNCFLLTPSVLLPQAKQAAKRARGFAEVMEGFSSVGFQIVGLRMILLRESQAEQCVKLFEDSLPAISQPLLLVKELVRGPCVVLAVLRSGAVSCFDSLLTSSTKTASALARKHRNHFLVGKTIKQARRLVECFFDELMPNNKVTLVPN